MEKGVYINGNLCYRSTNFEKCAENAIYFLYNEWSKHKEDNSLSQIEYLRAVRDITVIKDDVSHATYNENTLVIKPIEEKRYIVSYVTEFEECADTTDEDFISSELKYVCDEEHVEKVYWRLRNYLQIEIQDRGFKSFDEMLGDEIECLQDTDEVYEVYDKRKKRFHVVRIREFK